MQFISAKRHIWRILGVKKRLVRKKKSIVIAAMPKSGSTFLSLTLRHVTGFPNHYFAQDYKNIEQELDVPTLIDGYGCDSVTQQHFKANEPNIKLMRIFDIKPVVLYRNIPDVLVSMRDHLNNEALDNLPNIYAPNEFGTLEDRDQLEFLLQHAAPWLVAFFVSWEIFRQKSQNESMCLHYEDCRNNWCHALEKVLAFYDIPVSQASINETLETIENTDPRKHRKNVGIEGRGKSAFNESQLRRMRQLTAPYRDIDFTIVGL